MQAAVEDSPVQRDSREQEQGVSENLWKVLSALVLVPRGGGCIE